MDDEIKQLQALKANTTLSGLKKLEELRSVGVSFDAKVKPLLNAEQQPKFQALREALRRRMLEKIASGAGAKLEGTAERARGEDGAGLGDAETEAGGSVVLA